MRRQPDFSLRSGRLSGWTAPERRSSSRRGIRRPGAPAGGRAPRTGASPWDMGERGPQKPGRQLGHLDTKSLASLFGHTASLQQATPVSFAPVRAMLPAWIDATKSLTLRMARLVG